MNGKKCYTTTLERILSILNIRDREETIGAIIEKRASIGRFGDGELDMMLRGKGIKFQDYDEQLVKRLFEVLNYKNESFLVGITRIISLANVDEYNERAKKFWLRWLKWRKFKLLKILSSKSIYYDTAFTRFYIDYVDKENTGVYIQKLKKIWENQDICIVEGEFSRLGASNDLFSNAKSVQRILCPPEHAFKKYDEILYACKKISKDKLVLISLGPTATVLAYDLYKMGYWALDLGHIDLEYEWFLRKAEEIIKIDNKYVNEVDGGAKEILDIDDGDYKNSIIGVVK